MPSIKLPKPDGTLEKYELRAPLHLPPPQLPLTSRICYSAAHVVADPLADIDPTLKTAIDWDATLAYRHHLWRYGLGVAEAMDTAQRGMGLDWETAKELVERSIGEARAVGGLIACGAGTDHLDVSIEHSIEDIAAAYEEQAAFVEGKGGRVILMASRALAKTARGVDDYRRVYGRILSQTVQPVIIHWLGDMFDPELAGYWGTNDLDSAMDACIAIIEENHAKIDGIKISLLSAEREIGMRRRLPAEVKMYTGDDFNYPRLIAGDEIGFSHALLGVFDAIAPVAANAAAALDNGDLKTYEALFAPTVPLSRHIFRSPTRFYKTGIVFLAYLNGHQKHFHMVGGSQSARSVLHLSELFRLADKAGILHDPEMSVDRMKNFLRLAGVNDG